jgi:hypothetical protein
MRKCKIYEANMKVLEGSRIVAKVMSHKNFEIEMMSEEEAKE